MARLRYVRSAEDLARAAASGSQHLKSRVRSIRVVYETDMAIVRALTPQPLEVPEASEVCVTFSHVAMEISPEFTFEIGSAIFGTRASYEGVDGIHLIAMAMTSEAAVVGGRERYGEPKKIAEIDFDRADGKVSASVRRFGMAYLEFEGVEKESLGNRSFDEHAYCYKAFPATEAGQGFDQDPMLVRLTWRHENDLVTRVEGELRLGDSPIDPVADVPVRRMVSMQYEEGTSRSDGKVLRRVPGEWIAPFMAGRYDDPSGEGIEVGE